MDHWYAKIITGTLIIHCLCGLSTQRKFYENRKGHVEDLFLGGSDRPHTSGNIPDFWGGVVHKKLEGFQKSISSWSARLI